MIYYVLIIYRMVKCVLFIISHVQHSHVRIVPQYYLFVYHTRYMLGDFCFTPS